MNKYKHTNIHRQGNIQFQKSWHKRTQWKQTCIVVDPSRKQKVEQKKRQVIKRKVDFLVFGKKNQKKSFAEERSSAIIRF